MITLPTWYQVYNNTRNIYFVRQIVLGDPLVLARCLSRPSFGTYPRTWYPNMCGITHENTKHKGGNDKQQEVVLLI